MEEKLNLKYIDVSDIEYYGDSVKYTDKEYTINDCILVRTTNIFPKNGIVQTPTNGKAYGYGESSYLGDIIHKKLREKYPRQVIYSEEEEKKFSEELKNYDVCFENYRRTVHFALNGLVGSHAYGNFENRPYVILEPLKYHLDDSLKSLRVEDVYFDDDIQLSKESTILISEEEFKRISNNIEYLNELKNFKVYIFKGDQQTAVSEVLKELGYDSFIVNSNGYCKGLDGSLAAGKMYNFINTFANENNISLDRHYYSKIKEEDDEKTFEKSKEIDKLHLLYLLDNTDIPDELRENIKQLIEEYDNLIYIKNVIEPVLEKFVDIVGLDTIKELTSEFNKKYIANLKQKQPVIK